MTVLQARTEVLRKWLQPRRRVRVVIAGYGILILFAIAAGLTRWLAGATPRVALITGAAVAAPVLIAYVGERITEVKALGVQISLADVAVPIDVDVSSAVMTIVQAGGDARAELLATFESVIRKRLRLLQIDLRDEDYYWSTRLYLVARVAEDFTEVERLVFVRNGEQFVGLAEPSAVRRRLSSLFPAYQVAYRTLQGELAEGGGRTPEQELQGIIQYQWSNQFEEREVNVKEAVTADKLRSWLETDLDRGWLPHGP
jgi:hypothetical protein